LIQSLACRSRTHMAAAIEVEVDYDHKFTGDEDNLGCMMFIEHSIILNPTNNVLKNGALCVDVTIQLTLSHFLPPLYPPHIKIE
jgi:hypothetical protein